MTSDNSTKITGKPNETSDDSLRLFLAYDAVCHAEEQLDSIEKDIETSIPTKIDLCKMQEVLMILDKVQNAMINVQNVMTSSITNFLSDTSQDVTNLNEGIDAAKTAVKNKLSKDSSTAQLSVDSKYTKYLATQIILKNFQILKYRIEMIKTGVQITIATLTKFVLGGLLCGKGSAKDPINATMSSTMASAAATANTILSVIGFFTTGLPSHDLYNGSGVSSLVAYFH